MVASGCIGLMMEVCEQPLYRWSELQKEAPAPPIPPGRDPAVFTRVEAQAIGSMVRVAGLSPDELAQARRLVDAFVHCKVIREDTPADEWVLEVFWPILAGKSPPQFASALREAIEGGLTIRHYLRKMRPVWDDTIG
jgi:hypothetical protein